MDTTYAAAGAPFEQAAFVLTAVRSIFGDREAIVDAGLKAVSLDMGPPARSASTRPGRRPATSTAS